MEQAGRTQRLFHCSIVLLFRSVDRLLRHLSPREYLHSDTRPLLTP
jgi:hypothetical protein